MSSKVTAWSLLCLRTVLVITVVVGGIAASLSWKLVQDSHAFDGRYEENFGMFLAANYYVYSGIPTMVTQAPGSSEQLLTAMHVSKTVREQMLEGNYIWRKETAEPQPVCINFAFTDQGRRLLIIYLGQGDGSPGPSLYTTLGSFGEIPTGKLVLLNVVPMGLPPITKRYWERAGEERLDLLLKATLGLYLLNDHARRFTPPDVFGYQNANPFAAVFLLVLLFCLGLSVFLLFGLNHMRRDFNTLLSQSLSSHGPMGYVKFLLLGNPTRYIDQARKEERQPLEQSAAAREENRAARVAENAKRVVVTTPDTTSLKKSDLETRLKEAFELHGSKHVEAASLQKQSQAASTTERRALLVQAIRIQNEHNRSIEESAEQVEKFKARTAGS